MNKTAFFQTFKIKDVDVLVMMDNTREDEPCIVTLVELEGLGRMETRFSFEDTEEGWNKRNQEFDEKASEHAKTAVESAMRMRAFADAEEE